MVEQSFSPRPKKRSVAQLSFPDAMRHVIEGRKVTKLEWNNKGIYLYLDRFLMIRSADGKSHPLTVSDGDMLGQDWVVVAEKTDD